MARRRTRSTGSSSIASWIVAFVFIWPLILTYAKDLAVLLIVGGFFYLLYRNSLKHRSAVITASMNDIDQMSGREFERFLRDFFTSKGYSVLLTPGSGDFGADLVIRKEKESIAIQAKRYKGKVGVDALQQVLGGRDYYGCVQSRVVTNSEFTKQAVQFAQRTGIELWDRTRLENELLQMHQTQASQQADSL